MPLEETQPVNQSIRVAVQQPALPHYRLPVFRYLASRPNIDLTLYHGARLGAPPNVDAHDFKAVLVDIYERNIGSHTMMWHSPQWQCATRRQCDVLHLSWDIHYTSLIPALLRAKVNGVGTVLWGHGFSKSEASWRSSLRRKVANLADALLFYNHTAANRYIEQGYNPDQVFVALNSLDQQPVQDARNHWLNQPEKLEAFRNKHQLKQDAVIIYVSRLEQANRVDLLIKAAAKMRPTIPDLKVIVVGKGTVEDELKELARSLGVEANILFLGAIYGEMDLAPWFLCSDVFCYPANIGLSLLHAFGYGLPVVTSDNIAAHGPEIEALEDGINGKLYADANVEDLAVVLVNLFSDSTKRVQMIQAAHNTAMNKFTINGMVDGMELSIRSAYARHNK